MSLEQLTTDLDTVRADINTLNSPEHLAARQAAVRQRFEPGEPFEGVLPPSLIEEQVAKVSATIKRNIAERLYDANELIKQAEPQILAQLAIDRAALNPEQVGRMITGNLNFNKPLDTQTGLHIELMLTRLDRELANSTPREWLARYETALGQEHSMEAGLLIYATESALANGRDWPGKPAAQTRGDEMKLVHLQDRIRKAQEDRIPESTKKARLSLANARNQFDRLTSHELPNRIQPVRRQPKKQAPAAAEMSPEMRAAVFEPAVREGMIVKE